MKIRLALALVLMGGVAHAGPMHKIALYSKYAMLQTKAAIGNTAMKAVGIAELAGLKFPVKKYEARVSKDLWRGSRLDDAGEKNLHSRGFSAIVGLTAERDTDPHARADGLAKMRIGVIDNHVPSYAQVKKFLGYVDQQKAKGPVYVHCEAGVGRTGIMVAAYRMKVQGWDAARAIVEARKYGMKEREQILFIRDMYKHLDKI